VGLELRFTRTTQTDTTALALKVGPPANEARRQMRELRELDLQLALGRLRAAREDVEDQAGAVEYARFEHALEVALLAWAQRVVEHDELGAGRLHARREVFCLALADEQTRVDRAERAVEDLDDFRSGGSCEFDEFSTVGVVV